MRALRLIGVSALLLAAACDEDLGNSGGVDTPPPAEDIQAFLQVDNDHAQPGQQVAVFVRVQLGSKTNARLGSYTGRLRFDPEALAWLRDVKIDDGMRVINPNNASTGDVRFAGAAVKGFDNLVLYQGVFEVKDPKYLDGMVLQMEEVSAALTLKNLKADLKMADHVYRLQQAN